MPRHRQCVAVSCNTFMPEFKVIIPTENYELLDFNHEELPGVAVVNSALRTFEPKAVFDSHLSITLQLEELVDNGMPSRKEQLIIDEYGDFLDLNLKGPDKAKPNALFLARITWNKTRELVWRVYDAEIAHKFLRQIIIEKSSPREFEYQMSPDPNWNLAVWHLENRE